MDGGAEQFFQARFAQGGAKPSNLGGIAGWAGLEVLEACKVLPIDVLGKALHQFFIAEIETVLEQGQGNHEAHSQSGTTGVTGIASADFDNGAKQVWRFFALLQGPRLMGKLRRHAGLHFLLRQSRCQSYQWVTVIDHLIKAAAKEVVGHGLALQNISKTSQVLKQYFVIPESSALPNLPCKPRIHAGHGGFVGPTK